MLSYFKTKQKTDSKTKENLPLRGIKYLTSRFTMTIESETKYGLKVETVG